MDQRPVHEIMAGAPTGAQKLLTLIARQADRGPIHPKPAGVATPPEVLEACGLDVGHFYDLLRWLGEHELIQVAGDYPFEEIRLTPAAAEFGGSKPPR